MYMPVCVCVCREGTIGIWWVGMKPAECLVRVGPS